MKLIPIKVKIETYQEEYNYPKSLPGRIIQTISDANILSHFSPASDSYMFIFLEINYTAFIILYLAFLLSHLPT